MKAIVQTRYGAPEDVLRLREIDTPVVADDEVLVAVRAASVHPDVWHVVAGSPRILRFLGVGLFRPKDPVPGTDLAGVVESVGKGVSRFQPGDEVFGESDNRMMWHNGGAFAEYAAVPQDTLARKPASVSFEEAASVPTAGYIALNNFPAETRWTRETSVLINGAGGGVGTIALQIAKGRGARVTSVDCAEKLEMLRTLGSDRVIDYAQEDFTRGEERYDLIYDVASTLSLKSCKRVLQPKGMYVIIGHDHFGEAGGRIFGNLPRFFGIMARARFDRHLPATSFSSPEKKEAMAELCALLESGQLTPVIDRTFPLDEVPEAMRYMQAGGGVGRIIITP